MTRYQPWYSCTADTLKGSYYANPVVDDPTVPLEARNDFPQYYGKNICKCNDHTRNHRLPISHPSIGPKKDERGIENFEDAFKDLSRCAFLRFWDFIYQYQHSLHRLIFKVGCELAIACQPFGRQILTLRAPVS